VRLVRRDGRLRHLDEHERVGRASRDVADPDLLIRRHRRQGHSDHERKGGDRQADQRRASMQEP
jgi:hypothetical protein